MAQHKDVKHFTADMVPWSLRLLNIPLDAPHKEVESFLQKVGFASCTFYWDKTTKEKLGTKNAGWCIVVFPLHGLSSVAAVALNGRVFNGRTILMTQAPSPGWDYQQGQQQRQQQPRPANATQASVALQNRSQQQELPLKPVGQQQPVPEAYNSWNLRKHTFPVAAAARSIHLANIDWQTPRPAVLALLAREGFNDCKLYWTDENVVAYQNHTGHCWVELPSAAMAEKAWKALDGLYFKGRCLGVASLPMVSAYALDRSPKPTQDPQRAQSLSDQEGLAAVPQSLATPAPSLPLVPSEQNSMTPSRHPMTTQHALKSPVPPKSTLQDISATPASLAISTQSQLITPATTTSTLAVTTDSASQSRRPQLEPKPNAYEVARKLLHEPYQKLQETQDEADSKSRFILEKVMENLELFASGERAMLSSTRTTPSQ